MATPDDYIAALEAALGSGALKVEFPDGRSVTYRGTGDLVAALEYYRNQKRQAAGKSSVTVSVGGYFRQ